MADFLSETIETRGSGTASTTERKSLSTVNLVVSEIFFGNEENRGIYRQKEKKEKIISIVTLNA